MSLINLASAIPISYLYVYLFHYIEHNMSYTIDLLTLPNQTWPTFHKNAYEINWSKFMNNSICLRLILVVHYFVKTQVRKPEFTTGWTIRSVWCSGGFIVSFLCRDLMVVICLLTGLSLWPLHSLFFIRLFS